MWTVNIMVWKKKREGGWGEGGRGRGEGRGEGGGEAAHLLSCNKKILTPNIAVFFIVSSGKKLRPVEHEFRLIWSGYFSPQDNSWWETLRVTRASACIQSPWRSPSHSTSCMSRGKTALSCSHQEPHGRPSFRVRQTLARSRAERLYPVSLLYFPPKHFFPEPEPPRPDLDCPLERFLPVCNPHKHLGLRRVTHTAFPCAEKTLNSIGRRSIIGSSTHPLMEGQT